MRGDRMAQEPPYIYEALEMTPGQSMMVMNQLDIASDQPIDPSEHLTDDELYNLILGAIWHKEKNGLKFPF